MADGIDWRAALAEYVAMLLFVFICVGSATGVANEAGWILQVSLTFGLCITALAYTIGHRSGGQINCAVTLGLVLQGVVPPIQGAVNFVFQMLGSLSGAALLAIMVDPAADKTNGLGTNKVDAAYGAGQALVGEIMGTFLLMYVVLETAVSEKSISSRPLAALAIGFAVFLAHSVLIPVDGCSINPTRSFGPAVVASIRYSDGDVSGFWEDHWVFWVGPLVGACLAVGLFKLEDAAEQEAGTTQAPEKKIEM